MNELSTMYHYFKGISAADSADPATVQLAAAVRKPSVTSMAAGIRSEEYMEMNADLSGEHVRHADADDDGINAVTNLNYINIDSIKDEEIARNLNDNLNNETTIHKLEARSIDGIDAVDASVVSSELRVQEPAYYDSQECNRSVAPIGGGGGPADSFSQDCLNVLENCNGGSRSASSMSHCSTSSAATSKPISQLTSIGDADTAGSDYMLHPSNIPVLPAKPATNGTAASAASGSAAADSGDYMMQPSNRPVCESAAPSTPKTPTTSAPKSLSRQESTVSKTSASAASVDEELLEIMNDFKNNVFTIQEVEQLVDSWKARNDVRQSYKDKQDQLGRMREEYERVQAAVSEKMKHRPTPFERMRKLFGRKQQQRDQPLQQRQHSEDMDDGAAGGGSGPKGAAGRPRSSLSLQSLSSSTSSTSSSGRLSTGSACSGTSLGDSGTHSDPEERRTNGGVNGTGSSISCRLGTPGSLMMSGATANAAASDNYLIPPAPRPVSTQSLQTPTSPDGRYFGGPPPQKPTTLSLMAASDADDCSENYTMFPSNVPVMFASATAGTPTSPALSATSSMVSLASPLLSHHHDYMNFSGLNTIEEAKEAITTTTITSSMPAASNVMPIKVRTPDEIYGTASSLLMGASGNGHSTSSCTINGSANGGTASTVGYKRPSSGDLCSSFKPLATATTAAVCADAQSVRFQKGSLDGGLDRRQQQPQLDSSASKTASLAATAKLKLCKSSSSPSVGGVAASTAFSMLADSGPAASAAATGEQHDYMNV